MNEKEYILGLLNTLEYSIAEINLPGFSHVTVLDDIRPDSFQFAIGEIRDYINKKEIDIIEEIK